MRVWSMDLDGPKGLVTLLIDNADITEMHAISRILNRDVTIRIKKKPNEASLKENGAPLRPASDDDQ